MNRIKIKITPKIIRDDNGKYIIIDTNNKGGAIISDFDPFIAMKKFKEATILACSVRTLSNNDGNFYVADF